MNVDKEILDRLEAIGFQLKFGYEGSTTRKNGKNRYLCFCNGFPKNEGEPTFLYHACKFDKQTALDFAFNNMGFLKSLVKVDKTLWIREATLSDLGEGTLSSPETAKYFVYLRVYHKAFNGFENKIKE